MNAEIIAVGSELLTPHRSDTNSLYLTDQLNAFGVEVVFKCIVGDDRQQLARTIERCFTQSEITIVTGGLGPTEDDVTRDAAAQALGRTIEFRQEVCDVIEARFRSFGRRMAENNRRQAFVIAGAEALPNGNGTAPGQWIEQNGRVVMLLPGPPSELKPMFAVECLPRLARAFPRQTLHTREFRITGITESELDQLISPAYLPYAMVATTILAAPGDLQVHLRCRDANAESILAELCGKIEELLGQRIFSRDGASLEQSVGDLLAAQGATLSVAESCTAGLLGARISSVPGASRYLKGGFIAYTPEMKQSMLGIERELLMRHGAESAEVAEAMARGAREGTGAAYALSTTGFAGPDGGTPETPVGTVFIGLASDGECTVRRIQYPPNRERVRSLACTTALDMLRRKLMEK